MVLALDIGGANLKAADGLGFAVSRYFPLWRQPEGLSAAIAALLAESPPHRLIVAAMTGELADCFATKAAGVAAIVKALQQAAGSTPVRIYRTDGELAEPAAAMDQPLLTAAANWHALAAFACRFVGEAPGLLIDIGSTTTDIIPLLDGRPAAFGRTDPDRLATGELVYTGVERSPVCALAESLVWRGRRTRVAQELFATIWDAYLTLGDLPEEPESTHTADGRPATKAAARDRLARAICADRTLFAEGDALLAAQELAERQRVLLADALRQVCGALPGPPQTVVISGRGEFLARRLLAHAGLPARVVSLGEQLGPEMSRCATAHALAVLARTA